MKFKILELARGQSKDIVKCENGDLYDSQATLMDWDGKQLYQSQHWNTDKTVGYAGGRLAKGTYYGIVGYRPVTWQPEPLRVVKLFASGELDPEKITNENQIPLKDWTLPSDIPNPNHDGAMIIDFVQCHPGSLKWDWSHGCQTALNYSGYTDYDNFIKLLKDNEIIIIRIV